MSIKGQIIFFVVIFLSVFIIYRINLKRKIKKGKIKENIEIIYLETKFKLKAKKIVYAQIITWIALINAFIIAFVSSFVALIPLNLIFQLLIGFVLLFALIYALYEIYGRHLKKKWETKNE